MINSNINFYRIKLICYVVIFIKIPAHERPLQPIIEFTKVLGGHATDSTIIIKLPHGLRREVPDGFCENHQQNKSQR